MVLDNQDIAILTRVNELAEKHGVKPYDFVAGVRSNDETGKTELNFEVILGNTAKVEAMVAATGAKGGTLAGEVKEIIDSLDAAIAKAPKSRIK
jgi:hypothetical protein